MNKKSIYIENKADKIKLDKKESLIRSIAVVVAFIGVFVFFFKILFF